MSAGPQPGACAACGGTGLDLHLRVGTPASDELGGPQGLIPTTDDFGTALADIVRCSDCGHMQLERMPGAAELADAYTRAESGDYLAEEAGQRATAQGILDSIEKLTPPARLLDLGCWLGFLLAEATERGWQATGIEPSEFASAFARERLGLDVRTESLEAAELPDRGFEAAVLADVIEHFPDPRASLEELRRSLVPGGVLALALPDAGSVLARAMGGRWWSVIPTHVQYFTRESLLRLLARSGFETVRVETAPKTFSVRYYLERIGGYDGRVSKPLVGAARRAGIADRPWSPDFRDRMLVLARARG